MVHFLILAIMALIWFFPVFMIATSARTVRKEKIAWILAIFFISWFAWVFYLLLAPLKRE